MTRPITTPLAAPDGDCQDAAEDERSHACIHAAIGLQHPGERQTGDVGREGDCEVEAAGQNRKQHGKRQQAEFWQLERHGSEGGAAEELRRRETEEQHHGHEGQARPGHLGAEKAL